MYNSLDYYNYINNNYNQPLYTEDVSPKELYDPYEGFIKGNAFRNQYIPYKNYQDLLLFHLMPGSISSTRRPKMFC